MFKGLYGLYLNNPQLAVELNICFIILLIIILIEGSDMD